MCQLYPGTVKERSSKAVARNEHWITPIDDQFNPLPNREGHRLGTGHIYKLQRCHALPSIFPPFFPLCGLGSLHCLLGTSTSPMTIRVSVLLFFKWCEARLSASYVPVYVLRSSYDTRANYRIVKLIISIKENQNILCWKYWLGGLRNFIIWLKS